MNPCHYVIIRWRRAALTHLKFSASQRHTMPQRRAQMRLPKSHVLIRDHEQTDHHIRKRRNVLRNVYYYHSAHTVLLSLEDPSDGSLWLYLTRGGLRHQCLALMGLYSGYNNVKVVHIECLGLEDPGGPHRVRLIVNPGADRCS